MESQEGKRKKEDKEQTMAAENTQHLQLEEGEQIFTNCAIGGAVFVHVKDGRITKVRPIVFNEEDTEAWSIEAKGKTFTPPRKLSLGNYVCTMKSRIYSENRIQYPMLRVAFDPNGAAAAIVFKTISDQYGKYSMIKVIRGKVTGDVALYNPTTGNTEKLGRLYVMKGKKGEETKEICCGDIGAIGKMDRVKTGDTLCDPKNIVKLHGMDYAQPCYSRAISPKTKQEIEKLGTGLNKLNEEDPTFHVVNNAETHQTVISGAGDIQIDVLCAKLKSRFGVDAELSAPRVAYREKIRSTVRKQGRYKKQTGGSGQFGDVHIIFEPQNEQEDMIFEENVFGGSVPKNYFPAVEKGLRESCQHGVLAGYPVVFLKATLVDGSYHPVDSSEIAFKLAANLAFKAALPEAKPVLMEPIGELKVTIPDSYLGDVMGDLNKRRGRVMGMNPTGDGEQVLEAEVPMAEMMSYAIDLRSMTQSRGTFTFNFVRYEDCPAAAQEKAIAEAKALAEAE